MLSLLKNNIYTGGQKVTESHNDVIVSKNNGNLDKDNGEMSERELLFTWMQRFYKA